MAAGLLTAIVAGLAAFAVTWLVYRNAARLALVAIPGERSSHTRPTPTGGGAGIVAGGTIGAIPAIWATPWPAFFVVFLALVVAAIGFIDDRRPLPAAIRFGAQVLLSGAMVAAVPMVPLGASIGLSLPEPLIVVLLLVAAVYWINIFNFMDGIDGIAASQAAFMLLAATALALAGGAPPESPMLWWFIAIGSAALAFLALNWPPARIFMGDAGSTWLGFILAYAAFATIAAGWLSLWQWLILGAIFVADATLTLVRRLVRGEPIFSAHRLHAYQHLSRRWGGHRPVTLLAVAINVVWLLPWAASAGGFPGFGPAATVLAYLPVVVAVALAGAGAPEGPAGKS